MLILLKYWKVIAIAVIALALVGSVAYYRKSVYDDGFAAGMDKCRQQWTKLEKERVESTNKKIAEINEAAKTLANEHREELKGVSDKIGIALKKLKVVSKEVKNVSVEPLTSIPECKPTDKFIEVSNEIAKAANSK